MKKRYTVLGLSIVLALALAVPALGGPSNPLASTSAGIKQTANKALKKAKAAQAAANAAQATANTAGSDAAGAQKTASAAQTTANTAVTNAKTAQTAAAAAQTAAGAAQTAANAAQASANGKMSGEVRVEGATGTTIASAGCPPGKTPTGGGFIINGTDNNAATVTESSQYLSGWIVIATQIEGTVGNSWNTTATVNCATSP